MKKPWSKIKKGDALDLGGRVWTVEKIKPGKKKAKVRIRHRSNVVDDTVRLDDKVRIAEKPEPPKRGRRDAPPAKPAKQKKRPPEPATGDPWETQQDRIEKQLGKILGAHMVGESTDGGGAYYVPPVDITTVAAHLAIFHGTIDPTESGAEMMKRHALEHEEHLAGDRRFTMHHWHTEKRPTEGKKSKKKG